jgi:hypothetical protein
MDDRQALAIVEAINSLEAEVKELNRNLTKIASNTNNDVAFKDITDALNEISNKV